MKEYVYYNPYPFLEVVNRFCMINAVVLDNPEGPAYCCENEQIKFGRFEKIDVSSDNPRDRINLQNLYLPHVTVKSFEGSFDQDVKLVNKNNVGSDLIGFCFFLKGGLTTHSPTADEALNIGSGDQKFKFDPNSEMTHFVKKDQTLHFIHMSMSPGYFFDFLPANESWSEELREKILLDKPLFKESSTTLGLLQQMTLQNILRGSYDGKLGMLMLESSVTQVIVNLLQEAFNKQHDPNHKLCRRDRDLMHDVRDYIIENFLRPHSLLSLSKHFGINQTKLVSGFKTEFGTSIFEYIGGLKLQHAKRLLEDEGMFVQEVSSVLGYKNPNHFSAAFKRKFGINPSALKG